MDDFSTEVALVACVCGFEFHVNPLTHYQKMHVVRVFYLAVICYGVRRLIPRLQQSIAERKYWQQAYHIGLVALYGGSIGILLSDICNSSDARETCNPRMFLLPLFSQWL